MEKVPESCGLRFSAFEVNCASRIDSKPVFGYNDFGKTLGRIIMIFRPKAIGKPEDNLSSVEFPNLNRQATI
jgi:hypothetical protein